MIEDQPGRGESEEAGVIRERSIREQTHSGYGISEKTEVPEEKENEPEEKPPERGSDRNKEQPGRGSDTIEGQPR